MADFALTFPTWIIVDRDSVHIDSTCRLVKFGSKARVWFIQVDGKDCLPIFTDDDLAQRHMRENAVPNGLAIALENPKQLRETLSNLGFSHWALDPGRQGTQVRSFDVQELIAQLGGR